MNTLDAALPKVGLFQAAMERAGSLFTRAPIGWHNWPQAAQRIFTVLAEQARFCKLLPSGLHEQFILMDPRIMRILGELEGDQPGVKFRVGRRCVQKGLKQLEDLGVIRRVRQGGVRFIQILVAFAKPPKPVSQPGRKAGGASKAAPSTSPAAAENTAGPCPSAGAPGPEPEADPGPPLSPQEVKAAIAAAVAGVAAAATPGRRVGPTRGAAVPGLSDEQRARQREEQQRRTKEWLAKRELDRLTKSPRDQPAAPSGSDEIARE
jgi:hypothetical protein